MKAQGQKANSGALIASGEDARFDAILSASVLASAVIFLLTGLSLEAWVGVVISGFIIKSGVEMMMETLDDIIGHRADAELTQKIRHLLNEEPEVRGAYDLFLDNYGPDRNYASVHLELPDVMTVEEVDRLTRRVQAKVFKETGVILTGVGVYSYNTGSDEIAAIRNALERFNIPELMEITIDTVERYQGSQRKYILYGFTVQQFYQLRFLTNHVFEEDGAVIDRKLNVVMTRAQEHLLLFGHAALLKENALFDRLIDF